VRIVPNRYGCEKLRFTLWTYLDTAGVEHTDFYRPRIDITVADAGRTQLRFTRRKNPDRDDLIPEGETEPKRGYVYPGRFLSLATAVYDLSGEEVTLADACRMFDLEPPPIGEPNPATLGARMEALAALYQAVLAEFARFPGAPYLAPDRALSPTGIGKALLRSAGLPSPLTRKPREPWRSLGAATASYVGARSEVRVRRVSLLVGYVDAISMFLLVDGLMRSVELLTHRLEARHLTSKRELATLGQRLGAFDLDVLLKRPVRWQLLRGVALVDPCWDVLPSKASYSASVEETTAVAPIASASEPLWVPYPDLLASRLETDRFPKILEAWEWHPIERLQGLGSARLPDGTRIDLSRDNRHGSRVWDDPFLALATARLSLTNEPSLSEMARERMRSMLKAIGNGIGYGAEIEFNRRCAIRTHTVWGPNGRMRVHPPPSTPAGSATRRSPPSPSRDHAS
jgi:hypothetical protein